MGTGDWSSSSPARQAGVKASFIAGDQATFFKFVSGVGWLSPLSQVPMPASLQL